MNQECLFLILMKTIVGWLQFRAKISMQLLIYARYRTNQTCKLVKLGIVVIIKFLKWAQLNWTKRRLFLSNRVNFNNASYLAILGYLSTDSVPHKLWDSWLTRIRLINNKVSEVVKEKSMLSQYREILEQL